MDVLRHTIGAISVIATADVESFPHSFNIRADFAIKLLVF
jgi:hypothetical protein